jgi:hypothetical protein
MRHVYLGRNNFGSKKKMQLIKNWKLKLPARTCSQQQCLLGFNLWVWDWRITDAKYARL